MAQSKINKVLHAIFMHCELLFEKSGKLQGYNGKLLSVYPHDDEHGEHEKEFLVTAGCFGNYYVYSFYPENSNKLVYTWAFDETCTDAGLKPLSTENLEKILDKEYTNS